MFGTDNLKKRVTSLLSSGALTGKYKKGDQLSSQKSEKQEETKLKMPFGAFPNVEELMHNEKYWSLRDVMDRIAAERGQATIASFSRILKKN